jgi:16S rRNA (guanine966-N2)-methyltransferase
MRIIGGILRGREIYFLKNLSTRPLKDSVRENVFNILQHSKRINVKIENSNILDLYSGIGSFGLESISRGAAKVTFIEQDSKAVNIIKKNLKKFSIIKKSIIHQNKIEDVLIKDVTEKFDIFFFDPPFLDINFIENLRLIKNKKFFSQNHIVIIHRERKTNDVLENLLKIIEIKQYGRSKIIFGVFN